MVGLATVGVVLLGAVMAVLLHRWKDVSSRSRQVTNGVRDRLGIDPVPWSASVGDATRQAQHQLFREVGRSRLPDGRYTGGHYVVCFHPDLWAVVASRLTQVRQQLVDSVLADTGLDAEAISVVLRCDVTATVPVEVTESLLPPMTQPVEPVERSEAVASEAEAEAASSARLALEDESGAVVARLPEGQTAVVGRAAPATVRIADARVSETHARLVSRLDHFEVMDLGSRNGTHLNREEILGTARMFPGDLLRVGTTTLRLVDRAATELITPPRPPQPAMEAPETEWRPAEPKASDNEPPRWQAESPATEAGNAQSPATEADRAEAIEMGPAPVESAASPAAPVAPVVPAPSPVAPAPSPVAPVGALSAPMMRTEPLVWALRPSPERRSDAAPTLGWDDKGPVPFAALADPTTAGNGHLVIYGAPGMGKSQALRSIVTQARAVGITTVAVDQAGDFADLPGLRVERPWSGMDRNPLCPPDGTPGIERAKVEIVDALGSAVASRSSRMGHRQAAKLSTALDAAYAAAAAEGRWPTLADLHGILDSDLRGIVGEVTGRDLFRSGGPLGDILGDDVVVDLSEVPGVGTLQRLVTGLVLASLDSRTTTLPSAPGEVRHLVVIDEANRVKGFASIERLLREGRKAGVAVALSTQHPQDLPDVAHAIVGTTVCLRLGARAAAVAAAHLDTSDPGLADRITRLEPGMAFAKSAGQPLRRVRLVQHRIDGASPGPVPAVAS